MVVWSEPRVLRSGFPVRAKTKPHATGTHKLLSARLNKGCPPIGVDNLHLQNGRTRQALCGELSSNVQFGFIMALDFLGAFVLARLLVRYWVSLCKLIVKGQSGRIRLFDHQSIPLDDTVKTRKYNGKKIICPLAKDLAALERFGGPWVVIQWFAKSWVYLCYIPELQWQ